MDYLKKTLEYYSEWLDVEPSIFLEKNIEFKKSTKRDIRPKGYGQCFHLYCYISDKNIILSYSKMLENEMEQIKKEILKDDNISARKLKKILNAKLNGTIGHGIKFYFDAISKDLDTSKATQLTGNEYNDFLTFFKTLYSNTETDWVKDYYNSMVDRGYCWGIYEDKKLVSVAEVPDIPYMVDIIVEPGIATLENYRKKGYAKIVTGALIKYLIKNNKVPIWSCSDSNKASMALAYSLGFKKLADVLTFTIN